MRPKIKELAEQAKTSVPAGLDTAAWIEQYNKIFAELIVKECMSVIKQNENASLNVGNFTDEKKQGIQLGLEFAITDIAEHFGVEE